MFMPREHGNFEQDSEMLEVNMTNITNELSELVVGPAPATVTHAWMQPLEHVDGVHDAAVGGANLAINANRLIVPIQENTYFSNTDELRYSFQSFCREKFGNAGNSMQPQLGSAGKPRSNSLDLGANQRTMLRQFSTDRCFKRRASTTDAEQHEALLCAAIDERATDSRYACPQTSTRRSSFRRKFPRTEPTEPINYDNVVIDLNAIGLSIENSQTNDVMRLFAVFRKFHYYLNDIVPSRNEPDLTDYPSVFVKPTALMPCTMNVQSQIKHAIHRSNAFCYRLVEKLDAFKLSDRDKFIQCSRSLFILRKMIKQLEPFKVAEFEHRYGVFVNSFGAAQAKNLEILLLQIISKVRECNIYIEVFMWSIQKNMEASALPSLETLKKAVAIAGAILKDNPTDALEMEADTKSTEEFKNEEVHETDSSKGNDGNGGGIAGAAFIPAAHINPRAMKFIGV